MKVGIDISSLIYGRGVSRYTSNLVTALNALGKKPELYGSSFRSYSKLKKEAHKLSSRVTIQKYPPSILAKLWSIGLNKVSNQISGLDVFHSWDWLQPPDKNIALVSTIHDLAILKFPKTAHPKILAAHKASWKKLKDRKAHIIAVSHSTKKDIVQLLEIPPRRVHVIYEALPYEAIEAAESLSDATVEKISKHYSLNTKPYLLFVGTREPRKNLKKIISAWKPFKKDYRLLVVGAKGWEEAGVKSTSIEKEVEFLGRVSDPALAVLYSQATAFLYPSLDEGFGLPILEAFYHGCPVVTSDRSAMKEVAGNAAELVDPDSISSIKSGIETILNESKTEQDRRIRRMILRLQLFSWDKVATQTYEVYQQAYEEFKHGK